MRRGPGTGGNRRRAPAAAPGRDRRELLRGLGLAGLGLSLVALPLAPRPARAEDQARYVTWQGYDDPKLFGAYRREHGGLPLFSLFDDQERLFGKLSGGMVADVVHPCYEMIGRLREAELIQPVDTDRLRFWGGVLPELKALPGAEDSDGTWFVPVDWGQTSITYRRDLVELPDGEESWALLWDERYAGRTAAIALAEDVWWSAAAYAGLAREALDDGLDEEDFERVRELLERQRLLLRFYADDLALVEAGLASGELVAAMTWSDSLRRLRRRGVPVAFAHPKEGALTWCCGLVLHASASAPDRAYDIIDAMTAPEAGAAIIEGFGFGHANRLSFSRVSEESLLDAGFSRAPREILEKAIFAGQQPEEVSARIAADWAAILGRE